VIEIKPVDVNGKAVVVVEIGNPDFPEKPAIIVLMAKKGLIVCRDFDMDALDERNVTAAGVKSLAKIEDALETRIESCASKAQAVGVAEGMTGREALMKL
jgi:uncharacterized protein YunC (DUF1805 family)